MSEWGDMSIHGLLFQRTGTTKIQLRSSTKQISSSSYCKLACSCHDIAEKLALQLTIVRYIIHISMLDLKSENLNNCELINI
jgi:hypothetical protein